MSDPVITALQALHLGITDVQSAPTKMPTGLDYFQLPLTFTWPGETDEEGWKPVSGGYYQVTRDYIVRTYVKPITDGRNFDEGYQLALTLWRRFGRAYMEQENRNLAGAVAHITFARDSGMIRQLKWGPASDTTYHGFEYRVRIREKVTT